MRRSIITRVLLFLLVGGLQQPIFAFQPRGSSLARRHKPTLRTSPTRHSTCKTTTTTTTNFNSFSAATTTTTKTTPVLCASSSPSDKDDIYFSGKTTAALVGGQSVLVLVALALGTLLQVPNKGLGPDISFSLEAWKLGFLYTLPLVGLAAVLDVVEDKVPALQDVTKATQRSVLSLLGGTFKPALGLVIATVLGLAAGLGEEMLFRGILQYEMSTRFLASPVISIGASSLLFGALHAVTPMYAALATVASIYFGFLYTTTSNLAVPILCHAVYDVGALLYAHWTVCRKTDEEQKAIANWGGPLAGPL